VVFRELFGDADQIVTDYAGLGLEGRPNLFVPSFHG
jgi:hypothetical protein